MTQATPQPTSLRQHVASWLNWETAPLIEVGTVGGQFFLGICDTLSSDIYMGETIGLEDFDNNFVAVNWLHITYARPVQIEKGGKWPEKGKIHAQGAS